MGRLYAMRWSSVTLSAILGKVVSRSLPLRRVACTMPKITGKASRSSKGGRRSGRKSCATFECSGCSGGRAAGHELSQLPPGDSSGGTSPQTSVASLSLEQHMDAVGARVRQELRSQAMTPHLSQEDRGGARAMSYLYQAEAVVPPRELAPRQGTVPIPTPNASECRPCV